MYQIEKVRYSDLSQMEEVGEKCLPIYYKSYEYIMMLLDPSQILWKVVLRENDQSFMKNPPIVGLLVADYIITENRVHIKSIAVLEEHRRKGLASKLVNALKKIKDHSVESITLYAQTTNINGLAFYHRMGFKQEKLIKNYYFGCLEDADAYYLVLNLTEEKII